MKIILVCGARPNFMKITPLLREMRKFNASSKEGVFKPILVHTGQHYDYEMSKIFFEDLELPEPNIYLGVGSGTHAEQTGKIMIGFEKVLFQEKPDLVIVVGDVNSTLAAALTAAKLCIPLAHVEAGLRCYDRTMPEEINRLLTDAVANYLFTPSIDADENLMKEGIADDKIFLVGDVMIDTLLFTREKAMESSFLSKLGLKKEAYTVLTLHRPENVENKSNLNKILLALKEVSRRIPIVFPCHPRTRKTISQFGLNSFFHLVSDNTSNLGNNAIHLTAPLGYLDFLQLMINSKFVLTDSGGIQEETTFLGIPCLTLRKCTERPVTITQGTNTVTGIEREEIISQSFRILEGKGKVGKVPPLWDGHAAERIIQILIRSDE